MYFVYLILSILLIIIIGKIDKKLTIKYSPGDLEYDNDLWIFTYEGRVKLYKIGIFISLIPYVNCILIIVSLIILFCIAVWLLYNLLDKSKISKKLF